MPDDALALDAPAKLNLGLHVLRRRPDGYHDLATVFLPVGWADRLAARPADALALTCDDPALPTDGTNLVVRAARALAAHAGVEARAALHLAKRVPYGAGLGGGSSDAAAALVLLDRLWGLATPPDALHRLAAGLGADVPFFLVGRPAVAAGRGDELTPLARPDGTPYACPFRLVVAVPPVHVATADAFRGVTPRGGDRPDLAAAVRSDDLARWRRELTNDFQAPVEDHHPAVRRVREALERAGAGYASLSGSGSAVFGAFERDADAAAAAAALGGGAAGPGVRVWTDAAG